MKVINLLKTNKHSRITVSISFFVWAVFVVSVFFITSNNHQVRKEQDAKTSIMYYEGIINKYFSVLNEISASLNKDTLEVFDNLEFTSYVEQTNSAQLGVNSVFLAPSGVIEYYVNSNSDIDIFGDDIVFLAPANLKERLAEAVYSKNYVFHQSIQNDEAYITIVKPMYIDEYFYGFVGISAKSETLISPQYGYQGKYFDGSLYFPEVIVDIGNVDENNIYEFSIENIVFKIILTPDRVKNNADLVSVISLVGVFTLLDIIFVLLLLSIYVNQNKHIDILNHLTDFDKLTGLKNYNSLLKDVENLVEENTPFYFSFGSINNLKFVYDRFGHVNGDMLLKSVADAFLGVISLNTNVYRYSGEEFAFVIKTEDEFEVRNVLDRVKRIFASEIIVGKIRGNLSINMGVSQFPRNAKTLDELIVKCDMVIKTTSSFTQNNYAIYDEVKIDEYIHNQEFDTYVNNVPMNNFEVFLMAVVDSKSNKIYGFECLSRLYDIYGEEIKINEIIDSFERNGRIQELDEYTFMKACEYKEKLNTLFQENYKLSVNVSGLSFNDEYVENILNIYEYYSFEPGSIIIELTESNRFSDIEHVVRLFNKLKDRGIDLAVDDFGTGYSSLSYLANIPIQYLKIDKSFVQNYKGNKVNKQLLKIVKSFSDTFGCKIVAEGVDSHDQLEYIKKVGYNYYQGFLFSKAISFKDAISLINKNRLD
ncbi:hypothetical protein CI105_03835 [Candidatus Izimaplasma bacterium ZiA1]|uniref:bifunctional diguanylate cyclase/phosphodiesterase n=1 Tax=Candidatus Izimoplasma sp. ZiA1 TaxID=2024899 RepID=UPI000BAA3876|nr:hypothetical protein CI105_03835 [Candidatus Izimaplasma bacterium ZiA1]